MALEHTNQRESHKNNSDRIEEPRAPILDSERSRRDLSESRMETDVATKSFDIESSHTNKFERQ